MSFIRRLAWMLAAVCSFFDSHAQSADCPNFTTSKSEKALLKAEDTGKYDVDKRIQILQDAWEAEDECYACARELGHLLFNQFKRTGAGGYEAQHVLEWLVERCPDFHAEPWYELGALAYAKGNSLEALEHFDAFLNFSDEQPKGKRYERQAAEVLDVLDAIYFDVQFHEHEKNVRLEPISEVNTQGDEYLPALSPDGSLLFLTHAEQVKPKGNVVSSLIESFQWAHRPPGHLEFSQPENLAPPFNGGARYGGATISIDNRELFIAASNPVSENPDNIDLFYVNYEVVGRDESGQFDYRWGPMIPLPESINSQQGWEAQPALSADGKELFFAAVRASSVLDENGNPTMDLMRSERLEDGSWADAQPIHELNTPSNEKSPFLHPDGKTLYFSSDRMPSGGGYDILYSRRNESGAWEEPVNIGAPINTSGDEHGLVVASDGRQAYLGSRRMGTQGLDILGLLLPPPHRASEVTIVRGSILAANGDLDSTLQLGIQNLNTMEREYIDVNLDDGTFARAIELAEAGELVLFTEGQNTAFDAVTIPLQTKINAENEPSASSPSIILEAREMKPDEPHEMRNIQFATNSSEIDPNSHALLRAFADYLNRHPTFEVSIHGHTDDVGSRSNNQVLSEDRARSVKAFLESCNVNSSRIESEGFGPDRPKASNETAEGRALNRRTEFLIRN